MLVIKKENGNKSLITPEEFFEETGYTVKQLMKHDPKIPGNYYIVLTEKELKENKYE